MGKNRLEAFSDGVIAIIIMVLELKVPHGATFDVLLRGHLLEQAPVCKLSTTVSHVLEPA
jgi:uncharacterized membrane protein